MITSPTNQRGKTEGSLTQTALANWSCLSDHASVVSQGKAAADVNEVAKHLNITYDARDAENAGRNRGMQSYNGIYRITRNVSKFGWINQK